MARLIAIGTIWVGCTLAWVVLGSTLVIRSGDASSALEGEVHRLWGPPGEQGAPRARGIGWDQSNTDGQSPRIVVSGLESALGLDGSSIDVDLELEHRKRGLMWFPTYAVDFDGQYTFVSESEIPLRSAIVFPLAQRGVGYDLFEVVDSSGRPVDFEIQPEGAVWTADFAPGASQTFRIRYRTRGTSSWTYRMTEGTRRVKNFRLSMTADFADVDFSTGSLSPSEHDAASGAWRGEWSFESLIGSAPIGVDMPRKLNPGPLASRITFFAPVGLLFFFFVVAVFAISRGEDLHPLNYFFLGTAFFAFHLLFAYLVDHLPTLPSFLLSAAVSVGLVVSYARLFVGWRFALREIGVSQLLYLVLFSYTFFWDGFTGLAITIGAVVTLGVMMQLTGRIAWGSLRTSKATPEPTAPAPQPAAAPQPDVA